VTDTWPLQINTCHGKIIKYCWNMGSGSVQLHSYEKLWKFILAIKILPVPWQPHPPESHPTANHLGCNPPTTGNSFCTLSSTKVFLLALFAIPYISNSSSHASKSSSRSSSSHNLHSRHSSPHTAVYWSIHKSREPLLKSVGRYTSHVIFRWRHLAAACDRNEPDSMRY